MNAQAVFKCGYHTCSESVACELREMEDEWRDYAYPGFTEPKGWKIDIRVRAEDNIIRCPAHSGLTI